MSKPVFSFGLKKAAPAKGGAPPPPAGFKKPPPAKFSGDDNDEDGSENEDSGFNRLLAGKSKTKGTTKGKPLSAPPANEPTAVMEITEIDGFETETATVPQEDETSKRKKKNGGAIPPPPPLSSKSKSKSQDPAVADTFGDLSSALDSRKHAEAAAAADPSIYDYDAVYDSFKLASHNKKNPEDAAEEKKPRYFSALQKAAEIRDRDRQIAEEKRLKRERDAEGDEFADKEKFVTEAYKKQQEENRRLEEEEKKREEAEKKQNKDKGMSVFYKAMLEKNEREHEAMVKAAEEMKNRPAEEREKLAAAAAGEGEEEKKKSATERAKEINAKGGNVIINDDGEVVDKRQLLKGGLNVAPKKKIEAQEAKKRAESAAARGGVGGVGQSKGVFAGGGKHAMRERQTRMLEAQLEETLKRSREEEEKEREKIELVAKSRKTEAEISSAKERYLARKRAAEEAKKNGLAD
ncbi:nuclear speckle splicing regulatory protein 1 [Naviculisporaceae sp. PSN 640]